jgi:glycogen debranching enzyme
MAERCRGIDDQLAAGYQDAAEMIQPAFVAAFWNDDAQCLYDCIRDGQQDASVRPNQIFAVSLPHSPLSPDQQRAVFGVVAETLLTEFGLRTLSPGEPGYRARYGGSQETRDRAYHQGTVWAWLMGPFIEAYLRVSGGSAEAVEQAKSYLLAFDDHLSDAGLGYVSEIFDGDPPHAPHGCIAQAWSVAELLRAKQLIRDCEAGK